MQLRRADVRRAADEAKPQIEQGGEKP
jgi:hypothetical protein